MLPRMWGPVFEQARTPEGFAKVAVDAETGTIAWPGDADLAPDHPLRARPHRHVAGSGRGRVAPTAIDGQAGSTAEVFRCSTDST